MSAKLERVSGWEVVNPEWACNITRDKVYFSARFRLVVWGGVYGVGPEEAIGAAEAYLKKESSGDLRDTHL